MPTPKILPDPDETDLQEMVSYRKDVTGVDHTVFISPKGYARHGPRIKVAIDPPDSLDPRGATASIAFDGRVVAGTIEPKLLQQAQRFIELNKPTLQAYWDYEIDTRQLQEQLKAQP